MKVTKKKARCKYVLAIVRNEIEKFQLLWEETYPAQGDFDDHDHEVAVLRMVASDKPYRKGEPELRVGLECVVFLKSRWDA